MGHRRDSEPSPFRTGLTHAGLALLIFGGLSGALGAGIQVSGDPSDAGPRARLALFDVTPSEDPKLKTRLKSDMASASAIPSEMPDYAGEAGPGNEPSLGVEYQDVRLASAEEPGDAEQGDAEPRPAGIRINGKLVRPGESYGDVTRVIALDPGPVAGMIEKVNGLTLPKVASDGRTPADAYARPFANPGSKPVVALVIGGLGINATHTKSAIDELPADVTLSFAPDATRLQFWIDKARAAGHEVLIEAPMEAYDYGRMKIHPQTLLADNSQGVNAKRLEQLLSRATGYFGLINYQGAKLGDSEEALRPVLDEISQRGLALVDDGTLDRQRMDRLSGVTRLRYARADAAIDAKLSAEEISSSLMDLESLALENGAALGAGYAFPITIEMAKTWTAGLEQKGIVLAPVSALASPTPAEIVEGGSVRTGSLAPAPVNPRG